MKALKINSIPWEKSAISNKWRICCRPFCKLIGEEKYLQNGRQQILYLLEIADFSHRIELIFKAFIGHYNLRTWAFGFKLHLISTQWVHKNGLKFFLLISFPYSGVAGYNIFLAQLRLSLETMSHYLRLFI